MPSDRRQFTLRFSDDETLEKIREIAKRNRRSMAAEIEFLIDQHIRDYEKTHGKVVPTPESE